MKQASHPSWFSCWIEQAKGAIAQNQSLTDFVLNTHPDNRATAREAYLKVRKLQGFVGDPGKERIATPTMDTLKLACLNAHYTPSAGSFEDDYHIICFSVETVPGALGHPRWESCYNKRTGWLQMPGMVNYKLEVAP